LKKLQRRGPAPSAPIGALVARAAEALRQERFKEAIELFKLAIRQDPRPEWKESLADAYRSRARALAGKRMFKEAAMVLENTLAPDGTVRDPLLYLRCLIREGQHQKAAAHVLQYIGNESALPAAERAPLEELTAALLVAVPQRLDPARAAPSERTRWLELATASQDALAAWVNGASAEEMDRQLNRISLRSAFRPVRLLLKSLTTVPQDADRTRRLLEAVPPGSPFFPFRQAVEAAVLGERVLDAEGWNRLTAAQQTFVAETRGLPGAASQFLARSSEAARGGPATLFAFLLKQPDLPQAEVRSACLNLLPQIPDHLPRFERSFGPLSNLERHRVQALAAEARGDWGKAERSWRATVATIAQGGDDRQGKLSQGVVFRHLAQLAVKHHEIEGGDVVDDPVIFYLERSREADPEHVPTVLELIGHYRKASRFIDWHRLVDEAVQRFPEDSQLLLQATESAMARKAYKKAAGFARRLLRIDPINAGVRRQMIELHVAHARKQVRAKRPDLAAKELSGAAEWERSDTPSALLRIGRGLIGLQAGPREQAEAWLREGVELAGGGVAGWFRAALEAELMKSGGGDAGLLRKELTRARATPPTREGVMAIVSALGQPEAGENKRAVSGLLLGMRAWLLQAAAIDWLPGEFQALTETLARFDAFDLLQEYARAARRREPANPIWRFHEIVARTRGDADRLSVSETDDLVEMADAAVGRHDFHAVNRIERFLGGDARAPLRRGRAAAALPETLDGDDMQVLIAAMMGDMPKGSADSLRGLVADYGREGAVAHMVDRLSSSPLGPTMPEPLLRELCEAMVAKAMGGSRREHGGTPRRSRF
jgi:tetratricopeptide (TPR) repeat protein